MQYGLSSSPAPILVVSFPTRAIVLLSPKLTEMLKDTQDMLRKAKQSADRAAVASRQQVIILKNAQSAQVCLLCF